MTGQTPKVRGPHPEVTEYEPSERREPPAGLHVPAGRHEARTRGSTSEPEVAITRVSFEHTGSPPGGSDTLGIGVARPRLSWIVETTKPNWRQAAYEIEARGPDGQLRGQTGRIESDQSVLVPWPFAPLSSRERVTVRVRVWTSANGDSASSQAHQGLPAEWSDLYWVEAGLLNAGDWSARFVTPAWDEDTSRPQPAPMLHHEFDVQPGVTVARLYITALGVYEAQINGAPVGDYIFDPGWTSYAYRLRYQTFDVTEMLREGRNAIGAILGDGWYRGRLGFNGGRRNIYGNRLALLAQLEVSYRDGTTERIVTGGHQGSAGAWRAATGPILGSDIYDGETYDARLERPGWSLPGYDDHDWAAVVPLEKDLGILVAPTGPRVRRFELIAPVAVTRSPSGRTIVDFGQNLVGRLRITVRGKAGETITLRHAEILEHGELCTRPLRHAAATDRYTLRGDKTETWEPRFTFHGFRYAEVEGWPGDLEAIIGRRTEGQESASPSEIVAVVCHSDMERTGWFECSDPLVNRLHENVVWSMRGNFLDIPTDCPQRDERLGWTGDAQVFAPTTCFLYDTAGFFQSWLSDLAADQKAADGVVPMIIPNVMDTPPFPVAAWSDAAVVVPWVLYQRYGDADILAAQYESMRSWVDVVAKLAGEGSRARAEEGRGTEIRLWDRGFQFGDWLDPGAPPDRPAQARTPPFLVATAYFARSAELVGQAASVLGRGEDAKRYLALAAEVRDAFAAEYVTPAGRLLSDSATAYSLAIAFGLLPSANQRRHAGARLAELVRATGFHISSGFVGTALICDALCSVGEYIAAYRLLMQRDCPSWLYPVTMGATTIWERWDSMRPDGSINAETMTSFNHYAFGAVADWLHRTVGGLAPAEPGYRRMEMRPTPGLEVRGQGSGIGRRSSVVGITHARSRHRTPYGIAECAWAIKAGQIEVEVVVPPNATAGVILPGRDTEPIEVGSGTYRWSYRYEVPQSAQKAKGAARLTIDHTLGEIIDDPEAWAATLIAIREQMPEYDGGELDPKGSVDMSVRRVFADHRNREQLLAAIQDALAHPHAPTG